jgi:hypothetical protein
MATASDKKIAATATTATAKTAGTTAKKASGIVAYCVKTKQKNVPMLSPVINVKAGKFVAVGKDAAGNNMAAIMNQASAEGFVKSGAAKRGEGWS